MNDTSAPFSQKLRARTFLLRMEVYNAYGGAFCACCGESEPTFLTLDHSFNDGAAHRKAINKSSGKKKGGADGDFYRILKQQGFPQDLGLRVLCWNCNCGRQRNEGICPHQDTKKSRVGMVRLTEEDIQFIRTQHGKRGPRTASDKRWTLMDLANKYGISQATLWKIQRGRPNQFSGPL